jgi:hypothetical protein
MGGSTSSIRYRQHSSWDHVTTQAPPLRQSRDTFGGKLVHRVGFILRKFVTMHGHMNVKKSDNYNVVVMIMIMVKSFSAYYLLWHNEEW